MEKSCNHANIFYYTALKGPIKLAKVNVFELWTVELNLMQESKTEARSVFPACVNGW